MRVGLRRLVWLGFAVLFASALTGCAQPAYQFVSSDDRAMVMRVPRGWTPMETSAALKAAGIDPATQAGWTAFYDASRQPDVKHIEARSTSDPLLFVESIPIAKEERSSVTPAALRELLLPASQAAITAATKAHTFAVLTSKDVSTHGQNGARLTYWFKTSSSSSEVFDRIAMTDPKHTVVDVVWVHCNQACFTAHSAEIDDVLTSLTLKAHQG